MGLGFLESRNGIYLWLNRIPKALLLLPNVVQFVVILSLWDLNVESSSERKSQIITPYSQPHGTHPGIEYLTHVVCSRLRTQSENGNQDVIKAFAREQS